jgi:hypothetical protein
LVGFDNVYVPGAAAQVARNGHTNLIIGWAGIVLQKRDACHHHPRGAEAALQTVLFGKGFLDGVKLSALFQAFHSVYLTAIGLDGKDSA